MDESTIKVLETIDIDTIARLRRARQPLRAAIQAVEAAEAAAAAKSAELHIREGNDPVGTITVDEAYNMALYAVASRGEVQPGLAGKFLAREFDWACPECGRFVPYHERTLGYGGSTPCEHCSRNED